MPSRNDDISTSLPGTGSIQDREVARLRALYGVGGDKLSLNDLYKATAQTKRIK